MCVTFLSTRSYTICQTETISTAKKKGHLWEKYWKLNVADDCCAFYPPMCFKVVVSFVVNPPLNVELS